MTTITIKVRPSSSEQKIESFGDRRYLIKVVSNSGNNGGINEELKGMLSKYFGVPIGRIEIRKGIDGNDKIIELR